MFIIDSSFSSWPGFRPLSLQTRFVVLKQQSGLYECFVVFCWLWVCSFWPEHILLFLVAWLRDNHVDCFLEQFILHKWQVCLRLLKNIAQWKHKKSTIYLWCFPRGWFVAGMESFCGQVLPWRSINYLTIYISPW